MTDKRICIEEITDSNIMINEKGRRANFVNPNRSNFHRVRVDNCLVKEGPRADFVITKVGVGSVIVELKGSDVNHACEQLFATLKHEDCKPILEKRKAMLIVCARYPSFDSMIAQSQIRARKQGVRLKVVCDKRDLHIEELLGIQEDDRHTTKKIK